MKKPRRLRFKEVVAPKVRGFLAEYFWFLLRNLVGWILILAAPPLGVMLPGPGGLPVFLIGFALVTFPGKRKITARVLRGRRLPIEHRAFAITAAFLAIVIPGALLWYVAFAYKDQIGRLIQLYALRDERIVFVLLPIIMIALTWLVTRLSLKILNFMVMSLPTLRRKFRPWMKKWGMRILPPRRQAGTDEILQIHPDHIDRFQRSWVAMKPWLWRTASVVITAGIFFYMYQKIARHWHDPAIRDRLFAMSPWRFIVASIMFAVFLFAFRAFSWRKTLKGFGYRLGYAPATRIWSVSELARYLPGSIWQVVGRVYLCKPYGIPGAVCSTSQVLELAAFLMANVLVAVPCLLFAGTKQLGPAAKPWLYVAMALVPLLAVLLHPKIFYGIGNRILKRLGKPQITKRLRGKKLIGLLAWAIFGLLWQALALWLLVAEPLSLPREKWWVVAGAYCLAWIAGFLAVWAPGGLGVREIVFVGAMQIALPPSIRHHFSTNPASLAALLAFLSLLLRLWTIAGELMLTAIAVVVDRRGMFNISPEAQQFTPDMLESEVQDADGSSAPGAYPQAGAPAPSSHTSSRETPPKSPARSSAQ